MRTILSCCIASENHFSSLRFRELSLVAPLPGIIFCCTASDNLFYQTILLPNGLYGSVWGTSQNYNGVGITNLSRLEDYLFAVLEEDEHGNLPCDLADAIFGESGVTMSTKVRECTDENEKRLYLRLASLCQPVEL